MSGLDSGMVAGAKIDGLGSAPVSSAGLAREDAGRTALAGYTDCRWRRLLGSLTEVGASGVKICFARRGAAASARLKEVVGAGDWNVIEAVAVAPPTLSEEGSSIRDGQKIGAIWVDSGQSGSVCPLAVRPSNTTIMAIAIQVCVFQTHDSLRADHCRPWHAISSFRRASHMSLYRSWGNPPSHAVGYRTGT